MKHDSDIETKVEIQVMPTLHISSPTFILTFMCKKKNNTYYNWWMESKLYVCKANVFYFVCEAKRSFCTIPAHCKSSSSDVILSDKSANNPLS
jgi:hypothetical protein